MFGSYYLELAVGVAILGLAGVLWFYLLRASRSAVVPSLLRSDTAAQLSAVVEIVLLAFGTAYVIDALVRAIP
jgi:cytoskeletal protein RodZ